MKKDNEKLILYLIVCALGMSILVLGYLIDAQQDKIDKIREENNQKEEHFHFDRVW